MSRSSVYGLNGYRTYTERWRYEDTRCTSCGKPLYNRWRELRWSLKPLRDALERARHRKWGVAWWLLRRWSPRDTLWHALPLRSDHRRDQ